LKNSATLVDVATTGPGVATAERMQPDVVIVDFQLPAWTAWR
jgi:CheY-like chemotaxis protein